MGKDWRASWRRAGEGLGVLADGVIIVAILVFLASAVPVAWRIVHAAWSWGF